jgi:chromosomal replication initiator protein
MATEKTHIDETEFDPNLTFDTFVVGPANRLAYAAAKRASESPGKSYNPLFLYANSGLGKTHILSAMAHHTMRHHPERKVAYLPLENYLDELAAALERGEQDAMKDRYRELDTLLMDDVQFLRGQNQAQEMFLRALDTLTARGAQVVLASDRPPSEIDDLDARLLSRFSGGLIVDIGVPDYETRVAIMRKKAEERGTTLGPGVAEAMARFRFANVRELQGALNRVLAIQELEGRPVSVDDLSVIMGDRAAGGGGDGTGPSPDAVVEGPIADAAPASVPPAEPDWHRQLREMAMQAEESGFRAERLRRLMEGGEGGPEPQGWQEALAQYEKDLTRAREIDRELEELGNPWPEAATTLVKDPDRLEESESLLASARERARPFPALSDGPRLEELKGKYPPLAIRAAERLVLAERPDYNPLYLHSQDPNRRLTLLEAAGRTYKATHPEGRVALISVPEFAEEFINSISDGVAGAWRERWWTAEVLLLHGVEELSSTERAQDEFFHLFEALKRRGSRILLAADRAPSAVEGVDDRLRSRFEGGLVVELGEASAQVSAGAAPPLEEVEAPAAAAPTESEPEPEPVPAPLPEPELAPPPAPSPAPTEPVDDLAALRELAGIGRGRKSAVGEDAPDSLVMTVAEQEEEEEPEVETWFPSPERVVWNWPRLAECIVEDEG